MAYWVDQIANGLTFEHVPERCYAGSDEYFANPHKGNGNPNAFVNAMYRDHARPDRRP